jgi:phosphatidylinositol 3-kinase
LDSINRLPLTTRTLYRVNPGAAATLQAQWRLVKDLRALSAAVRACPGARPKKIDKLRALLSETDSLRQFRPVPVPLDVDVSVCGFQADSAYVFKSALMPLLLSMVTPAGDVYPVIYKTGDDLRQDQLVIQIISLMDQLLKKENLDLKLTPYHVLATSASTGLVQLVPSKAIANILKEDGSIQNYLRKTNLAEDRPYKISLEAMDTYVKSCAGYCVITYLLGVGDRHFDNLMLCPDGHLFHIDFGYILGRDPKPYPPPMKLTREMVEAMGGATSEDMRRFRSHCYNAFLILRRHANLILNLFALMVDSNVHDIALDPDKTVLKVQAGFRLDLAEDAAVRFFQELIDESVTALFAQFVETFHRWAQYYRK